ncbi:MAG TPA: TlpA disulfide reductase family protein [Vicinamibacterales bacterium]|jgi:peroxiredoxin|nr:TlpA disulfide reductase family protein [Vicinamibacterales bacterium]
MVIQQVLLVAATALALGNGPEFAGRWDATVVANGVEVPFEFEIVEKGAALQGSFFNGDERVSSTSGRIEDGRLVLRFDQFATRLDLALENGALTGEYNRGARGTYPFRARRAAARSTSAASSGSDAPSIDGVWIVEARSKKGESAWRFIARQSGPEVTATILRVDGDTGTLRGRYRDGRFVLSHFSGARPLLLEVTPAADGTLTLVQNGQTPLRAARVDAAAAREIGEPTDPERHTTVNDPAEPLRFAFTDLNGRPVTDADERFRNKVVLVNISGSWCPNCHDEAPFLASLYRKYRSRGLEIVTLSFEEAEQLPNPTRLRAFIEEYGIEYTVLLAGEPEQLAEKVPQAVNLNAFPTTFILGRDGRVRGVHAGFPSPGSGEYYAKAKRDITTRIERLLAERRGTN